jgi:hypothetical protein
LEDSGQKRVIKRFIMNKVYIRYILFFIVVAVLLLFLYKGRSPFGKRNTSFAIEPGTDLTRIEMTQGDKKLYLEKTDDTWILNGKTEARKSAVSFILRTLKELKIKSPVSPDIYNNEITEKDIVPVKVKLYARKKPVRSFYVYKTGSNIYGNIMKMRESSKPFIVFIPGYEDNISVYFTLNELFWQPYVVFNLLPSLIASVSLENYADTASSFLIVNKKEKLILSGLKKNISGWDPLKVKRYITYFTMIPFETWAFDLSADEKKKLESEQPLCRITVVDNSGVKKSLTIWEKWLDVNGNPKKDTDRVWAKTNLRDDLFVMRYFDIDPILKKKSYFFGD